jgi:hypothetical protein
MPTRKIRWTPRHLFSFGLRPCDSFADDGKQNRHNRNLLKLAIIQLEHDGT